MITHVAATPKQADGLRWSGRFWPEPDNLEFTLRRWARDNPDLEGCRTTADVLDAVRRSSDRLLAFLVAWAQLDCPVADHLIARTMAPKLRRMADRDPHAEFDDYLAHLWLQVQQYPLHRRPERIAANLALDTLKAVIGERNPLVDATVDARVMESRAAEAPHREWVARLIEAGRQLGLFDDLTAEILVSVYADRLTGREAAELHATTPEMVRYRCSRYVRRMADHREVLIARLRRPELEAALRAA